MQVALAQELPICERPQFESIYREHFDHVWFTLRRLGVQERDLDDATHEVFVVINRRLSDFDPTRPLRPWVTGITYRVASDERRRARHRREIIGDIPEATTKRGPLQALEAKQAHTLVMLALEELPMKQRAVFVMHELQGMTMPEIMEALDAPLNTLYSRLRLARRKFTLAARRLRGRNT
jgi:RNA polymerase sigma-70 factor (ECF subfamily)